MPVITVNDVLKRAEEFEQMLADYYAGLSRRTTREGVRLLTQYMSRHRVRISQALGRFPHDSARRIRTTPLKYAPQAADCRCFEKVVLPPNPGAAQVLDAAVAFDECLISLYRHVLRQPVTEEVKMLFESLVRSEERDEIELKKIKAMDYF